MSGPSTAPDYARLLAGQASLADRTAFVPGGYGGIGTAIAWGLALAGARALGVALPQTAGAAQLMQVCAAHGMQGLDHSALVRALELMADHDVAAG